MKEGLRLLVKEALEFRNSRMPIKITMEELAKLVFPEWKESYAVKTIYCWNTGKYTPVPSPEDIARIAKICGVSTDFLIGYSVLPARELLDEVFVNSYREMLTLLNEHYNVDENPVFKTANEVWNQRFLK